MLDRQLFSMFAVMPVSLLAQGESPVNVRMLREESRITTSAIFEETRRAVAALALAIGGVMPVMATEPVTKDSNTVLVANDPGAVLPDRSPEQKDFLKGLDRHLKSLEARGIVAKDTVSGINQDFMKVAQGNPKIYEQPGFEYAIPTVRAYSEPYGALFEKTLERSTSRAFPEIIGEQAVTEANIRDIFRRMFASTKEDGLAYDMFVKEVFRLWIEDGSFRTATGEVDKQAVYEAIDRYKATNARWQERFDEMAEDGTLSRFVLAVNNAMAYAERKKLSFKPAQLRKGLVQTASCITAKPETNPSLYADSCAYTMTWMAERPHVGAIELQFYNTETGEAGFKRTMAPWDAAYAKEVYGDVFSDTQAKANDNFWRDYFKLYMWTAKAHEVTARADIATAQADEAELLLHETEALTPLVKSMSRLAHLLRCYVESTPVDGKKVTIAEVQTEFDLAKRLKAEIDNKIGQKTKNDADYKQLASNFKIITSRALQIGVKWV